MQPLRIDRCLASLTKATRVGVAASSAVGLVITACKLAEKGALVDGHKDQRDALSAMHCFEPVEEMQHAVTECFGSSCFGLNEDRLIKQMQLAFADAMREYGKSEESAGKTIDKVNKDFPSLAVNILNDNCGTNEFELNSHIPIPIENDFFSGSILIFVRPQRMDDSYPSNDYFSKSEERVSLL